MKHITLTALSLVLSLAAAAPVSAQVIDMASPFDTNQPFGVQTDANTPPPLQTSISLPGNSSIASIHWWGFYGFIDPAGYSDTFDILLGATAVTPSQITVTAEGAVYRYDATFNTPVVFASATNSLSLAHSDPNVEWFWQNAEDPANPGNALFNSYSYRIEGTTSATPVPGPLPVIGALAAFGWSRKLRNKIREAETA